MSLPEHARVGSRIGVAVATGMPPEVLRFKTSFNVKRWDQEQIAWARRQLGLDREPVFADFEAARVRPYQETQEDDCNNVTQGGWAALLGSIAGTSIVNKFSATYGRIGVGTSSTAFAWTQTTLVGDTGGSSTTSYFQLISGAPVITTTASPGTLVFTATFATGVANFAWNEFGVDNYTTSSVTSTGYSNVVFLDRGISAQGTKLNTQSWTATVTLSCT
jgi:hypothetical protein